MFMQDLVPVFGDRRCSDLIAASRNKRFPIATHYVYIHVNNLQTHADVVRWYLEMNTGGTPHTDDEITRVRKLLKKLEVKK